MYRHSADDIKESKRRLFCTPEQVEQWNSNNISVGEREYWNNKADADHTHEDIGGVSSEELANLKVKLDGIEVGANKYVHPNNETTRHVTDEQIEIWNNKADADHTHDELEDIVIEEVINVANKLNTVEASINEMKTKLDTVEEGANKYVHPNDANTRHVSDEQIQKWNAGIVSEDERTIWNDAANAILGGVGGPYIDPYYGRGILILPSDADKANDELAQTGAPYRINARVGNNNPSIQFKVKGLKFGKYVCTMRVRCGNHLYTEEPPTQEPPTQEPRMLGDIMAAKIYKSDDSSVLAEQVYAKIDDIECTDYSMIYLAFDYKAPRNIEDELTLEISTVSTHTSILVDYVEFNVLLPGLY